VKTLTISEFERELKHLLEAVRNGEHITVTRGGEQIEVVPDNEGGWSSEMLTILNNPNPNWELEPEPFPRRQTSSRRDPFAENNH
jgi:prevent-host-death family protein